MLVKLQSPQRRCLPSYRAGWFAAGLCSALLSSGSGALAADAGPGLPGAAADWNGLYLGASAGGIGLGSSSRLKIVPSPEVFGLFGPLTAAELSSLSSTLRTSSGALGGAQIGFNHRVGSLLLGVEADFSLTSMRDRSSFSRTMTTDFCAGTPSDICLPAAFTYHVDAGHEVSWVATARARLGYLATERVLVYATGGLALGGVHTKVAATLAPAGGLLPDEITAAYAGEQRRTRIGPAVGGGLEYAFTDRISFKAEYLYVNLGSSTLRMEPERDADDVIPVPGNSTARPDNGGIAPPSFPGASISTRDDSQFHSVRIGINLHF